MKIKDTFRRLAFGLLSQPKANVKVVIQQVNYCNILRGKRIVITGGSRGIGFSMAKKFIHSGATVLITGRHENELQNAISELGDNAKYLVFDNSQIQLINSFFIKAVEILGGIDSCVLNAGISLHEGCFLNVTLDGFNKQFDVNLKANYFLAQSFLKYKLSQNDGGGQLLFISSETAGKCVDIPYGLTKASINSLVGALSRRVYQKGIRVNAIAPGVTMTQMTGGDSIDYNQNIASDSVAGRWLLPEEIAEVACFLLSDASKCISGEVIYCDAGSHLKINGSEIDYSF